MSATMNSSLCSSKPISAMIVSYNTGKRRCRPLIADRCERQTRMESRMKKDDEGPLLAKLRKNLESVLLGKSEVIQLAMVALLAEGHILIEDVPGVGKTLLAKALARSLACT